MSYKKLATQNYKRFCAMDGSEYIASEFALETILKLIKVFNVKHVLELGLGIGSISDTVLKYSKIKEKRISYIGTEQNEFCLEALKSNVEDFKRIELYSQLSQIKNGKFDMIIIDGYDKTLLEVVRLCRQNTMIFIEGDRKGQTKTIRQIFPNSLYVNVITLRKNKLYSHGYGISTHYIGGGQLIFINPTFKMKLFWFNQKATTFIKNKIRRYQWL